MKKLEELLVFLYERREDDRIAFQKEKRPDNRNYYIYFEPDVDPANSTTKYSYRGRLMIYIDQENKCITLNYGSGDEVVIEDDELIKTWSNKIEQYIQEITEKTFLEMIDEAFGDAHRKDFHRDWKLKKILDKEDESI
jgi:hypothetical protein